MNASDRFWSKVEKTDGCWLWLAGRDQKGYGRFWLASASNNVAAHRYAYEEMIGPIPDGLVIDHLCRTPACVNPAHMETVTNGENVRRGFSVSSVNRAKTHCKWGHPFSVENTRIGPDGRSCRVCARAKDQRSRDRRRNVA